jgi:hypothetical protein
MKQQEALSAPISVENPTSLFHSRAYMTHRCINPTLNPQKHTLVYDDASTSNITHTQTLIT